MRLKAGSTVSSVAVMEPDDEEKPVDVSEVAKVVQQIEDSVEGVMVAEHKPQPNYDDVVVPTLNMEDDLDMEEQEQEQAEENEDI